MAFKQNVFQIKTSSTKFIRNWIGYLALVKGKDENIFIWHLKFFWYKLRLSRCRTHESTPIPKRTCNTIRCTHTIISGTITACIHSWNRHTVCYDQVRLLWHIWYFYTYTAKHGSRLWHAVLSVETCFPSSRSWIFQIDPLPEWKNAKCIVWNVKG